MVGWNHGTNADLHGMILTFMILPFTLLIGHMFGSISPQTSEVAVVGQVFNLPVKHGR